MTADRKYYRVNEWCTLNAISRRSFYREVAAGRIVVRKYGTRTLVPAGQSLPTSEPKPKMTSKPEHAVWAHMIQRCTNSSRPDYKWYGGRGIQVCKRWLDNFWNFYEDMGARPTPMHQIDRINNEGSYEPGNCRWATAKEQAVNRRKRRPTTYPQIYP